jgi:transcriptional regulator CtsR
MADGGPLMKYHEAYFAGEIDAQVFALIANMATIYAKHKEDETGRALYGIMGKLFSRKCLTPKEEQAIRNALDEAVAAYNHQSGTDKENILRRLVEKIDDVLGPRK